MRRLVALGLVLLLAQPSAAIPADWQENDWVKFIDATVGVVGGELYGGAFTLPANAGGKFPLVDIYAALSGIGSAVKPGLLMYLQRRMRDAADQGDYARMDGYQAYYTALATGDNSRLLEIQRKVVAATGQGPPLELTLNKVFAENLEGRTLQLGFQFTLSGNAQGRLKHLEFEGEAWTDGYSRPLSGTVEVKGDGYQAGYAHLSLPHTAPPGSYRFRVWLKGPQRLSSDIKRGRFTYSPQTLAELDGPKEPSLTVSIAGRAQVEVGERLTLKPVIRGGTPPYRVVWVGAGKTLERQELSIRTEREAEGRLSVRVTDAQGKMATDSVKFQVVSGFQAHIQGPKHVAQYRDTLYTADVKGGQGRLRMAWQTESGWVDGSTFQFSAREKGPQEVVLRVWDEGRPDSQPKTFRKRVEVHPGLIVRLQAPAQAVAGEPFRVSLVTEGGHGRQSRLWKAYPNEELQRGLAPGQETTMSVTFNKPDTYLVSVEVWDDITPRDKSAMNLARIKVVPGRRPPPPPAPAVSARPRRPVASSGGGGMLGNWQVRTMVPSPQSFVVTLQPGGRALVGGRSTSWSYSGGVFSFQGKRGKLRQRPAGGFIFEGVITSGSGRQMPFFQVWERR